MASETRHQPPVSSVSWQPSLLAAGDDADFDHTLEGARRRFLGHGAWVDHVPGWVQGADGLFADVLAEAPWQEEQKRPMYDRIVDVPRLTTGGWHEGRPPLFDRMARCLGRHYGVHLPSISANLYRDGNDSVAWHGDRIGRHRVTTIVAIVSLGSARKLLLRPEGGGASVGYTLHPGDLLVQGGTCQKAFQHCVPKRAHAGPRISVMFRELNGN
ncbi:MAG: alpha-ketoglutarate-dependent dioxygenase AlkB [Acidimicrobiales bacterium]